MFTKLLGSQEKIDPNSYELHLVPALSQLPRLPPSMLHAFFWLRVAIEKLTMGKEGTPTKLSA